MKELLNGGEKDYTFVEFRNLMKQQKMVQGHANLAYHN